MKPSALRSSHQLGCWDVDGHVDGFPGPVGSPLGRLLQLILNNKAFQRGAMPGLPIALNEIEERSCEKV